MNGGLTLESRVKICDEVLFQELEGEAVLLDLKSGVYFGLDPVGARIWQLLQACDRLADVAAAIAEDYDVGAEQCEQDTICLVDRLVDEQLVYVPQSHL